MTGPRSRAICVLGMHRSGTSVITRAINLLGVHLGEESRMIPPAADNAEGFWEHIEIVSLHDEILRILGRTWDTNTPLPERWWHYPEIQPLKAKMTKLVRDEFGGVPLWGWKDPRTCILLPMWEEILNDLGTELHVVLAIRNPQDVIASLERRDGFSRIHSAGIWYLYTLSSLIGSVGHKRVIVHYDHFLEDWEVHLRRIADALEIPWPDDANNLRESMRGFIKPQLRHSRNDLESLSQDREIPVAVVEAYRMCLEAEGNTSVFESAAMLERVEQLQREYLGYAGLLKGKCEYYHMQLFWPLADGGYQEEHSVTIDMPLDEQYHIYEVAVPEGMAGTLRLDPIHLPGYVEIGAVDWIPSEAAQPCPLASEEIGYDALIPSRGISLLAVHHRLCWYTTDKDPQFLLHLPQAAGAGSRLRIGMSVSPLPLQMMGAEIEQQERLTNALVRLDKAGVELDDLRAELKGLTREIGESSLLVNRQTDELAHLRGELAHLRGELVAREDRILKQSELLHQAQGKLNAIHASGGWRALLAYYRLRDALLPAGTARRKGFQQVFKLFKLGKKSMQYIRMYGMKGYVKKVVQKTRAEQAVTVAQGPLHVPETMIVKHHSHASIPTGDKTVSVIIPTLNAGADFEPLVSMLQNQIGFKSIQVVVVDSGSTDGTVELAREYGCLLVQIRPEEFSHSYARNLGAEHATGDYLLFTTQDALPPTDQWLYELYSVLLHNDVMAVSCAETPREDADLFYRLICWNHYRFLEVNEQDRVMEMPVEVNHLTLRKNGQLSDIANLISKEVFDRYKYRFNYAEDLDLGIRLIREGHKIAFLGSTRIIHSHLRPAYYFLKRGYVDNLFLSDIFEDFPVPMIQVRPFIRDILYVYDVLTSLIQIDLAYLPQGLTVDSFIDTVKRRMEVAQLGTYPMGVSLVNNTYADERLMTFLRNIQGAEPLQGGISYDGILIPAMMGFLSITFEYIRMAYEQVNETLLEDFKACIYKEFALLSGAHLAYAYLKGKEEDRELLEQINGELKKGV